MFTLSLSAASANPVTVAWRTANGTAVAGRDYVAGRGTVTFAAGQTRQTIGVWVIGDRIREGNETFSVSLSSPVNATFAAAEARATGTIVNDDGVVRRAVFAAFAASPVATASTVRRRR